MTDGAKRIANLVGDARRQASERGELQLLSALTGLGSVFEEHQGAVLFGFAGAEFSERHQRVDAARADDGGGRILAAAQPASIRSFQRRGNGSQHALHPAALAPQDFRRRVVGEDHRAVAVQHHDAGAHAPHDVFIEARQMLNVERARRRQCLAAPRPLGQCRSQHSGTETGRAEQTGLRVVGGRVAVVERAEKSFAEQRHAGQRCKKHRRPS